MQHNLNLLRLSQWWDTFSKINNNKTKQMKSSQQPKLDFRMKRRWEASSLMLWLFLVMHFSDHAGSLEGKQEERSHA